MVLTGGGVKDGVVPLLLSLATHNSQPPASTQKLDILFYFIFLTKIIQQKIYNLSRMLQTKNSENLISG